MTADTKINESNLAEVDQRVVDLPLPSLVPKAHHLALKSLFRQYDIRGIVSQELDYHEVDLSQLQWSEQVTLTPALAYALGCAYAAELLERLELDLKDLSSQSIKVVVGYDARLSGPVLSQALELGLRRMGLDVLRLGLVPTPVVYFSTYEFKADKKESLQIYGGLMVTGSHNPSAWNGFKLSFGCDSVYGEMLQKLYQRITTANYQINHQDLDLRVSSSYKLDLSTIYLNALHSRLRFAQPNLSHLKVVIDAGHGASGPLALRFFESLGVQLKALYCDPDGHFPAHHPDPTVESNLTELKMAVREWDADVGLGFDGDGDRLGVVDREGQVIWGDQLLLLFAQAILKEQPQAMIIGEVKCSQILYDGITEAGGIAEMWKVGHSLIKARMKEAKAPLAGEMSGHLFFADRFYGFDDALYAAARLIERLSEKEFSLVAWRKSLPNMINTPELRVYCADQDKQAVITRFASAFAQNYTLSTIDGVRVQFAQGWGLVRASNTQPVLVMRFEANSEEWLSEYRTLVESWLAQHAPEVRFDIDPNH